MLTRPSDKEILGIAQVSKTSEGAILKGYLARCLADVKDKLVAAEADSTVRKLQGRAEALKDLVEALEASPDLVLKLENRAKGR